MIGMGWLFWLAIAILIFGVCGRACGWRSGGTVERHRHDPPEPLPRAEPAPPEPVPAQREEAPLPALQRRFVEGQITLEEYERELDALPRLD
jgi:hypothetical protein